MPMPITSPDKKNKRVLSCRNARKNRARAITQGSSNNVSVEITKEPSETMGKLAHNSAAHLPARALW